MDLQWHAKVDVPEKTRNAIAKRIGDLASEHGDLIRADDQGIGLAARAGNRLLFGQPFDQRPGRFVSKRGFVDSRGDRSEWQAEPLQQACPVARGGG